MTKGVELKSQTLEKKIECIMKKSALFCINTQKDE